MDWCEFFNQCCWKLQKLVFGGVEFMGVIEHVDVSHPSNELDPAIFLTLKLRLYPMTKLAAKIDAQEQPLVDVEVLQIQEMKEYE